jgi:DNA (cytosine-5)-methyltransferase 1
VNGLALCSGIAGLELGINRALAGDLRSVCFVERDSYAASTLVARMEDSALDRAPVFDDLKSFDGTAWRGTVDLISAGYPCQPFSQAGARKGADDPRHLWPEVARIICEVGPRYICLENVRGHLSLGFDRVLGELADLGFDAEWEIVAASEVGAPHRRQRLFVLAYATNDNGWSGECREEEGIGQAELGRGRPASGGAELADAGSARSQRRRYAEQKFSVSSGIDEVVAAANVARLAEPRPSRKRKLSPEESEQLHDRSQFSRAGFPSPWPPGPNGDWNGIDPDFYPTFCDVRRMANGFPSGMVDRADRLRCLGNAVVPAQAEEAFRRLFSRLPIPISEI